MNELTIVEYQIKMKSGDMTARTITEAYLARIAALDKQGPALNAIIELNPNALDIADQLDRERQSTGPRGPLHGIPVLIKDNIDTADKMTTTAGSLALSGSVAKQDAFIARKLREVGAIILGKTNLSEWANFRSTRSTSGWSSRGGQTRNPYVLNRNPCGSSSGSGVAVAANLCAVAIGTETDGSVICPSHTNGIVGIKPTLGLVSRSGIIPIAHSQDTAGPMARTVADTTALLGALTGIDSRDPITAESQGKAYTDYIQFLDADGLRGARIGVARNLFGFHEKVDTIIEDCLTVMREAGADIIDPANLDTRLSFHSTELEVLLYEFKADLNSYLAGLSHDVPVRSLADIIAFNEQHREQTMPFFEQELMHMAQEKGPLTDESYREALATNHRLARTEGIDAVLQEHQLDAIIAPSGGPAWLTDYIKGDPGSNGTSSSAAVAGYPNITIPAGYISGLPIGISFMGGAYQEPTLIKLAYSFEQATQIRQPPQFLETVTSGVE